MPQADYCEMCGSPIKGRPREVIVEGASLTVCESCYSRVSERGRGPSHAIKRPPPGRGLAAGSGGARPPPAPPQRGRKSPGSIELEVVDDYPSIVRRARERLGWSTQALANRIMESENVIRRIEQGKLRPTIELAKKLERALGIKLLEPVSEEEKMVLGDTGRELTLGDLANIKIRKGD